MDLRALAPLLHRQGPFATLYLPTHRNTAEAAAAFDVLWKDTLRELDERGLDTSTRDALYKGRGSHADGGTLLLVAAGGELLLRVALPEAQDTAVVRVGPLPHLLPLLGWAQTRVPHVVVLVDHNGADILGYVDGDVPAEVGTVAPASGPVHKASTGGYNERRYQRGVEETAARTAKDVAAAVQRVARDTGARLVLIGGDEREARLVRGDLPGHLTDLVRPLAGPRDADGGAAHIAEAVLQALAEHAAAEVDDLLERFATYRGRATKDRARPLVDAEGTHAPALNAAEGVEDVVEALRMAQVGTLLLTEDLDAGREMWCGPDPLHLAITAAEVRALGVADPFAVPLADGLARAALGGDAEVRLVSAGTARSPRGGVGALLRYSTPSD